MRMRAWMAGVVMLASALMARAADVVLVHATVYTEPGKPALKDAAVLMHDGKIVAVGPTAEVAKRAAAAHATVYDCTGKFVTAGFWNSHVHLMPPVLLEAETKPAATLNAQLETMFTRWGFTSVFDIASSLKNTNAIRKRIAAGELVGPRILTTGEPFWAEVPIYVQQYVETFHVAMPAVTTPAMARERVEQQVKDGADGIKIFAGSIEENKVVLLPLDIAKAAVDEAHKQHRLVFSHPSSVKGVELSLDAGADILAHVSDFEGPWNDALVQRMMAAHISLIPTLTLFDVEMHKAKASAESTQEVMDLAVGQLQKFYAAGGQVLFGTDIGYIDHYETSEEFALMAKAGMSFKDVLASLTTNPAGRFGFGARSGKVAAGMDADVVVLGSDPAGDVKALSDVKATVRGGAVAYGKL